MPYKKKYKKKTYKKKPYNNMQVSKLLRQMRPETKHHEVTITADIIDVAGQIYTMNRVVNGTGDEARVGNSITCKNLVIRWSLLNSSSAPVNRVRLLVISNKQDLNATPNYASVLDQSTGIGAVLSSRQWDKRFKYKTLYDRVVTLGAIDAERFCVTGKTIIRLRGHRTNFESPSSSGIEDGGIYFMVIGESILNTVTLDYQSRLTFYDN